MRAAKTSASPESPARTCGLTIPLAIVAATLIEMKAPTKLRTAETVTATLGLSAPRCNRRRHRIGRIVKPVGEVERQRRDDHEDQDEIRAHLCPEGRDEKLGNHRV